MFVEGDLAGEWDVDRLQQIVSNLIGNALQHGQRPGSVQVRLEGAAPDAVAIAVSNEGTIPPEMLSRLVDPFRSGSRAGRREGLGLGLFIAQQIAVAHGGRIAVASSADTVTVFRVTMPRRVAEFVRL